MPSTGTGIASCTGVFFGQRRSQRVSDATPGKLYSRWLPLPSSIEEASFLLGYDNLKLRVVPMMIFQLGSDEASGTNAPITGMVNRDLAAQFQPVLLGDRLGPEAVLPGGSRWRIPALCLGDLTFLGC